VFSAVFVISSERSKALKPPPAVIARSGSAAGPGRLLVDLERARWAYLATHGFFAAPKSGVRQYLYDEKDFLQGVKGERVGAGARSPLTQTGLVLAGANLKGKEAGADGGILTAEALAGLDLRGLELAVLSACETGLGEAASRGVRPAARLPPGRLPQRAGQPVEGGRRRHRRPHGRVLP
jgi:hypothetical protein